MRLLTTAPLLLLATTAQAGDRTPPGLERVCEQIQPEATTSEVITTALDATTLPTCDHASYQDGRCRVVTRAMSASPGSSLGVAVLDPEPLVDGSDGPLYTGKAFSLAEGADPSTQAVSVWVDDKLLLDRQVLGEDLEFTGYLVYSKATGTWNHVIEAHGAKISFPTTLDTAITPVGATLSVSDIETVDGLPSTVYTLDIEEDEELCCPTGKEKCCSEPVDEGGMITVDLVVIFTDEG